MHYVTKVSRREEHSLADYYCSFAKSFCSSSLKNVMTCLISLLLFSAANCLGPTKMFEKRGP